MICTKVYHGPDGDPAICLTFSGFCNHIFNDAEAGRMDTFLYCPDSKGNVLYMTKHHTQVTFEEAKKYVIACEGPVPDMEYFIPHGTIKRPD